MRQEYTPEMMRAAAFFETVVGSSIISIRFDDEKRVYVVEHESTIDKRIKKLLLKNGILPVLKR